MAPLQRSPRLVKTEIPKPFKIPRKPNLMQIHMANAGIVPSAVDAVMAKVWGKDDHTLSPNEFIDNSLAG